MQVHIPKDVAAIDRALFRARLAPGIADRMRTQATAAGQRECCGLLIGRMSRDVVDVHATLPAPNVAPDAARSFVLAAAAVLSGQRMAEAVDLDIVGFYHSHPRGNAEPSPDDVEGAPPGYLHLIVAMNGMRAWRRADPDLPLTEVPL